MRNFFGYISFALGICLLLSACKKELVYTEVDFAYLNIDNKTIYNANGLDIHYNNLALNTNGISVLSNIKVPAGRGNLSFTDSTGKSIIDTIHNFEAGKTLNWVLFQPSKDVKPVILENNGSSEAQPDVEHIKIKFANFALKALPKPFDVVFYSINPETFEFIEGGRIDNVPQNFPESFSNLVYKGTTDIVIMMLVDHQTQQPLLDDVYIDYLSEKQKRILTLFVTESDYSPVTGTPYKISVKSLFEN